MSKTTNTFNQLDNLMGKALNTELDQGIFPQPSYDGDHPDREFRKPNRSRRRVKAFLNKHLSQPKFTKNRLVGSGILVVSKRKFTKEV